MLQQPAFIPQQQFHALINFSADDEHAVAILPNKAGKFRVVDGGSIIADVDFNMKNFICYKGQLDDNIRKQLEYCIKHHYAQ